jgi:PD-(D/E)XK nuclease superfamily
MIRTFNCKNETYTIIGISMERHREPGFGFSEIIYTDAIEFGSFSNEVPVEKETMFDLLYKNKKAST